MPSFVIETFAPSTSGQRLASEAACMRQAASALEGHVTVIRSYLVPGDEMGFHVLEADTLEAAARVASRAGIEVERIVMAIGVDPGQTGEGST